MRFGLVGTGHWARTVHAPALAAEPAVDFAGVWGRAPDRRAEIAARFGVRAYPSYDVMIEDCDALAFAVAPDAQADLAARAAAAGKHLMLEKPIATAAAAAARLDATVRQAGVASVVFFSCRFDEAQRRWLSEAAEAGGWRGGWAVWLTAALAAGSPYRGSAWRQDKGALWDIGPHVLSILVPALGTVVSVTARAGARDLVHLVLAHDSGATSTATMALSAPRQAARADVTLWGQRGLSAMPAASGSAIDGLRAALRELAGSAASKRQAHPCDVRFGHAVVRVLAAAEAAAAAAEVGIRGAAPGPRRKPG
jgi:predicted dehydrogenase